MRLAAQPNKLFAAVVKRAPNSLGSQIEDSAHRLKNKNGLIARACASQHGHWRLQHPFDDAMTERIDSVLLVRTQIAEAPVHTLDFKAAHGLKTLS